MGTMYTGMGMIPIPTRIQFPWTTLGLENGTD